MGEHSDTPGSKWEDEQVAAALSSSISLSQQQSLHKFQGQVQLQLGLPAFSNY